MGLMVRSTPLVRGGKTSPVGVNNFLHKLETLVFYHYYGTKTLAFPGPCLEFPTPTPHKIKNNKNDDNNNNNHG